MADVRTDRGQLILVAAFGVAVMLVALALILNTAIYTENLATRGSDISGGKDAARYHATTEQFFDETLIFLNYNENGTADSNANHDALRRGYRWAVWNYSNVSGRQQALDSVVVNVTLEEQTNGVRVQRRGGDFSNSSDAENWTVVEDASNVRNFTIDADASTLAGESPPPVKSDPTFHVNFTDDDDNEFYEVHVFNNTDIGNPSGELVVNVTGRTATGSTVGGKCKRSYDDGRANVNITGATVEGDSCGALELVELVTSDSFDIEFNQTFDGGTSTIDGDYTFVVDADFNDVNSEVPTRTRALYSAEMHIVYESKRLYYETDIRVAPGEFP